jgi:hypothetical protein
MTLRLNTLDQRIVTTTPHTEAVTHNHPQKSHLTCANTPGGNPRYRVPALPEGAGEEGGCNADGRKSDEPAGR